MKKKVGIQGIIGSFHHSAADIYFKNNDYKLIEYDSFKDLALSVDQFEIDFGIMAIENTIAGSILTNYNLLSKYNIKIIGEIYLPVEHNLMAYPGQRLKDIREIYSHPMALLQCEEFLNKHPLIKVYEFSDTASAAKFIYKYKKYGIAAIASKNASKEYKLEVLNENIHTIKKNFTRFFVIKNYNSNKTKEESFFFNKASLMIKILHTTGSLSKTLGFISSLDINMTKIQSIPIIKSPWEYVFYVDVIFKNINNYIKMKNKIQELPCLNDLSVMGEYKNGIL